MYESRTIQRKNYWGLDIGKFLCAVLIICAHFASEMAKFPTLLDYCFSIYIIAVPFFFACSGFLFFKKWLSLDKKAQRTYLISYQKRIWTMYGLWTVVYMIFVVESWIRKGTFGIAQFLKWAHMALVIQTYATIWFLPALAIGVAITCFLVSRFSKRTVTIVSIILYVFGMLGYSYYFLIEGTPLENIMDAYLLIFKTTRNGLFNAVPLVFMGFLVADKETEPSRKEFGKYFFLTIVSLVLLATECFILKLKFDITGMDICIFLVPFTYFFLNCLVKVELKYNIAWLWCRKLSLLMFVSQRLFLSALPAVLPALFNVLYGNSCIGMLVVLLLIITFSVLFIKLSEKVSFLKKFI